MHIHLCFTRGDKWGECSLIVSLVVMILLFLFWVFHHLCPAHCWLVLPLLWNLSERCDNLVLQQCSACICVMLPSQRRLLAGPGNMCKFEFLQDVDKWGIAVVLKSTRFICKCQEHEQTLCRSCNCQKRAFAHLSRNSRRSLVDQVRTVDFGLFPY